MSPHRWMNGAQMSEADAEFMRTHVHLRGGLHAGQEPVSGAGITALYDAILLGMRDYIARHEECASFVKNTDPWDAPALYHALVRAGVFDDPLRFNRFSLIVERALWQGSLSSDAEPALAEAESMLAKLSILPLGRSVLPGDPTATH
jgi:hypothetical protein